MAVGSVDNSGTNGASFTNTNAASKAVTINAHPTVALAGNANDALVIPAGLAFAKAIARRPELELYQKDKRHPTLAGTYLAACTTYAAIQKKSPVGNKYSAGLDAELAAFLQTVAADTVREYFGKDRG